eukprot:TRINITY_DN66630_c1_g2_i1.p2 TRINITY_DN66630_c1_g2~~TRINITY_DN66630_c1_g2_i1.p2  ORF type:complete len:545 (-),score=68.93 TRINITY_DN66630_c1_g2_i1:1843-3477(-)
MTTPPSKDDGEDCTAKINKARNDVEELITNHADASALLTAARNNLTILQKGATHGKKPLDYCSKSKSMSPLEMAVTEQLVPSVRVLLENDLASVDEIFGFNCTCLCKCCYSFDQNMELIKVLLYYGAEANATISNDTSSATCLITAIVKGNLDIVKLLLDYGANIYYEWKGQNALSLALDFRKFEIVEVIEQYEFKRAKRNRGAIQKRTSQPNQQQTDSSGSGGTNNEMETSLSVAAPLASGVARPAAPVSCYDDFSSLDWVMDYDEDIQLGEKLGEGGFGAVYKAHMKKNGDTIAVKMCHCQDVKVHQAFKQEVKLLSTFRHESIVLFRGACLQPPRLCIVSELMSCNLYEYLHEKKHNPSWALRLRWVRDLARGMNYLHSLQPPVVHRDLKSLNVLLDEYNHVKLCDFGMARVKEQTFIVTGHIGGSPAWMAPECLRGDDFNEKSDVFAFGVLMWEILTRACPWPGKQMAQLVGLVGFQGKNLELPTDCPPELPPSVFKMYLSMVNNCWVREASERPTFQQLVTTAREAITEYTQWEKLNSP